MVDKRLYEKLKEVAQNRGKIHYKELATMLGMPFETNEDRNQLYHKLGEISRNEHLEGRPLLSVIVVQQSSLGKLQIPGKGFFELAIELGRWDGKGKMEKFFYDELKRVWKEWSQK
jgi:hypothetical protein